jgi:hypothetical membrane protein
MFITNFAERIITRLPRAGALAWVASLQFLVVQAFVAFQWPTGYSIDNTISDLGVQSCGEMFNRFICSPWHTWFNVSLIVLGVTMIIGSVLLYQQIKKARLAFIFMGLGGLGTVIVGLFPLGTNSFMHGLGAFLPFFIGNISLVMFGYMLPMSKWLRRFTLIAGYVSLIAFMLFVTENYLGLGAGGMERITAHLQTIWLITFGLIKLKSPL